MPTITPFLWFDAQAEEAAALYATVFPNSRICDVTRYGPAGPGPEGQAMTVVFELDGLRFTALNGGPHFQFSEAISFVVPCETQDEIDAYWEKLTANGGAPSQCGWLKDRFGLSWQIVPTVLPELIGDRDPDKARRATEAMLKMTKLDIAELRRAHAG
ncbi:VOC family protein [Phenylobacterium sp. LjRoot225]|uniref:VOC family protein n=1 Tax=Phenylobacterium sp. LjRoot225 TaxID=3342285 RepID=UPI003ED0F618